MLLSSFCPCSFLVGQGAEGPPAWAHGPGVLPVSGSLFPAPYEDGQKTGTGTAAFLGTIVCLCSSGSKSLKQHILPWTEQPFCLGAAGLGMGVVGASLKSLCTDSEGGSQGGFSLQAGCLGGEMLRGAASHINHSGRWSLLAETPFPGLEWGYHSLTSFRAAL